MNTIVESRTLQPAQQTDRYNIYRFVHKGLRSFMMDTLTRAGRMDDTDICEVRQTLEQVCSLLAMLRSHVDHENGFLHTTLERIRGGASLHTADDHVDHLESIAELERLVEDVLHSNGPQRSVAAQRLYGTLSVFVAENLEHMQVEETENHAVLIGAMTDTELFALEGAIMARIPPAEMALWLKWILPAINAAERHQMLAGLRANAPSAVYEGTLALARECLSDRDWYKLETALAG